MGSSIFLQALEKVTFQYLKIKKISSHKKYSYYN